VFRLKPDLRPWQDLLVKQALPQIPAYVHKAKQTAFFISWLKNGPLIADYTDLLAAKRQKMYKKKKK